MDRAPSPLRGAGSRALTPAEPGDRGPASPRVGTISMKPGLDQGRERVAWAPAHELAQLTGALLDGDPQGRCSYIGASDSRAPAGCHVSACDLFCEFVELSAFGAQQL